MNTNIKNIDSHSESNSENTISDEQDLPRVKNPVGRPRTAIWRRTEDGKYNNNPLSEAYFRDYYKEHLRAIYIECPHCKKPIGKHNYPRHLASGKKCLKIRNLEKKTFRFFISKNI